MINTFQISRQTNKFLSVALVLTPAIVLADVFSCPPSVTSASSVSIIDVPASWEAYNQAREFKLVSAGFSDGRPSDMAYLKNPTRRAKKGP